MAKRALGFTQVYRLRIDPRRKPRGSRGRLFGTPWRPIRTARPSLFPHHDVPGDPRLPDQYGLEQIRWQALMDGLPPAEQAVVIAIIDSGVDYTHEDLAENIWINTVEASGRPGVDDDNNGYVDDIRGWDFTHTPDASGEGWTTFRPTTIPWTSPATAPA